MKKLVDIASFWENIYKNNSAGWDLKSPTPAFIDILNDKKFLHNGKLLILGSGYGYDAVEAAKAGLNVTAVDFSETATNYAKKLTASNGVKINFLKDNFFNLPENYSDYFDYAYDYVTICAINPDRREEYAAMLSSVLKCNGKFVALWFPVEDRAGGPPFGLNVQELTNIFTKYFKLIVSTDKVNSIKPRKGREFLQVYEKICEG